MIFKLPKEPAHEARCSLLANGKVSRISSFVTFQMLLPLVTINCGVLKPRISYRSPLKFRGNWPQRGGLWQQN